MITIVPQPLLWYTSGSPQRLGQTSCAYQRWLEYHAGPHGTGYRRKGNAVPLATGGGVHHGIQLIGEWILEAQTARGQRIYAVPDEVVAWAALEAAAQYERTARARGLLLTQTDLTAAAAIDELIMEQRTLIEAQVWIYALVRLPLMLSRYRLVHVEYEETPVLDCTCGLGDWVALAETHAARNCRGIVMQGKADFLWLDEQTTPVRGIYEEFKTKSTPNYSWEQAWETSGQLLVNMEAATQRTGIEFAEAYVPVLYKGKRDRQDRSAIHEPKIQMSPLCRPWYDPGNGMMRPPQWATQYKWCDDWGKWHTLPKSYSRVRLWDENLPLPTDGTPNQWPPRAGASRVEHFVRGWIAPGQMPDLINVLGPFAHRRRSVPDYTSSILAEERMWRERTEFLRAHKIYTPADQTTISEPEAGIGPETIEAATIIPRSWNCVQFNGSNCQFRPLCHKEPGWDIALDAQSLASEHAMYQVRTPHHDPERAAYEAVGMVFPEAEDEDDDE
jgi:hypothetical protein